MALNNKTIPPVQQIELGSLHELSVKFTKYLNSTGWMANSDDEERCYPPLFMPNNLADKQFIQTYEAEIKRGLTGQSTTLKGTISEQIVYYGISCMMSKVFPGSTLFHNVGFGTEPKLTWDQIQFLWHDLKLQKQENSKGLQADFLYIVKQKSCIFVFVIEVKSSTASDTQKKAGEQQERNGEVFSQIFKSDSIVVIPIVLFVLRMESKRNTNNLKNSYVCEETMDGNLGDFHINGGFWKFLCSLMGDKNFPMKSDSASETRNNQLQRLTAAPAQSVSSDDQIQVGFMLDHLLNQVELELLYINICSVIFALDGFEQCKTKNETSFALQKEIFLSVLQYGSQSKFECSTVCYNTNLVENCNVYFKKLEYLCPNFHAEKELYPVETDFVLIILVNDIIYLFPILFLNLTNTKVMEKYMENNIYNYNTENNIYNCRNVLTEIFASELHSIHPIEILMRNVDESSTEIKLTFRKIENDKTNNADFDFGEFCEIHGTFWEYIISTTTGANYFISGNNVNTRTIEASEAAESEEFLNAMTFLWNQLVNFMNSIENIETLTHDKYTYFTSLKIVKIFLTAFDFYDFVQTAIMFNIDEELQLRYETTIKNINFIFNGFSNRNYDAFVKMKVSIQNDDFVYNDIKINKTKACNQTIKDLHTQAYLKTFKIPKSKIQDTINPGRKLFSFQSVESLENKLIKPYVASLFHVVTNEQAEILELDVGNSRNVCIQGGYGTGKTLMLLIHAMRQIGEIIQYKSGNGEQFEQMDRSNISEICDGIILVGTKNLIAQLFEPLIEKNFGTKGLSITKFWDERYVDAYVANLASNEFRQSVMRKMIFVDDAWDQYLHSSARVQLVTTLLGLDIYGLWFVATGSIKIFEEVASKWEHIKSLKTLDLTSNLRSASFIRNLVSSKTNNLKAVIQNLNLWDNLCFGNKVRLISFAKKSKDLIYSTMATMLCEVYYYNKFLDLSDIVVCLETEHQVSWLKDWIDQNAKEFDKLNLFTQNSMELTGLEFSAIVVGIKKYNSAPYLFNPNRAVFCLSLIYNDPIDFDIPHHISHFIVNPENSQESSDWSATAMCAYATSRQMTIAQQLSNIPDIVQLSPTRDNDRELKFDKENDDFRYIEFVVTHDELPKMIIDSCISVFINQEICKIRLKLISGKSSHVTNRVSFEFQVNQELPFAFMVWMRVYITKKITDMRTLLQYSFTWDLESLSRLLEVKCDSDVTFILGFKPIIQKEEFMLQNFVKPNSTIVLTGDATEAFSFIGKAVPSEYCTLLVTKRDPDDAPAQWFSLKVHKKVTDRDSSGLFIQLWNQNYDFEEMEPQFDLQFKLILQEAFRRRVIQRLEMKDHTNFKDPFKLCTVAFMEEKLKLGKLKWKLKIEFSLAQFDEYLRKMNHFRQN